MKKLGALTVVGTGIKSIAQITIETRNAIKMADKVLYLVAEALTQDWLTLQNSTSENIYRFYADGKPRYQTYQEMVEYTLQFVRQGLQVCVVYYGHPGVFCYPGREAIKRARAEGHQAYMLPGISAEDCLFSDLLIEPGLGCQSYEATDFLVYKRLVDSRCTLILWQIGVTGHMDYQRKGFAHQRGVELIVQHLSALYPAEHQVIIYEAPVYVVCEPSIQTVALQELPHARISATSTLVVPPLLDERAKKANLDMVKALRIEEHYFTYSAVD